VGDDRAVDGIAEGAVGGSRLFLEDHGLVGECAARAAVLLRNRRAEEPDLTGLVPELAVDVLLRRPPLLIGNRFAPEELAGGLAQKRKLVGHPG
jgi:hypothetical protein